MVLQSGVYVIENVHNRNWAILTNDNDGDDVISGTDADTTTGHKWEVTKLHNGTYLLCNEHFRNHASYKHSDTNDHASVISIRTGDPKRWRVNSVDGVYWISDLDGDRCWSLRYDDHETPIKLEKYTHNDRQHWKILGANEVHDPQILHIQKEHQPTLKQCPPPSLAFTGRRDVLTKMHAYFSADIGKRHIFVLHGLGGVGKSEISRKFIEESQVGVKPSRFSDVYFVDATTAETATSDLRNIALTKGAGDSAEDALQWLSRKNEEWLLVIDNADDTTLNLRDFFPCCPFGNIIITSRNSETRIHSPDPKSNSKVSGLIPDDANDLLFKIAGVVDEQSDQTKVLAMDFVKELGHLALAVVQAGAYISKSGCGLVRYIKMYKDRRTGFLEEYRDQVQKIDDYKWTVYTTWTASFEKLSTRSSMFMNICAFFHHDGISEAIFQKAAANIGTHMSGMSHDSNALRIATEFLTSFLSPEGQWDIHEFLAVVSEIRSYSLIDFDKKNETYSIHPLVHDWARNKISDTTNIRECSQFILSLSMGEDAKLEDFAFRRFLLPHVDASLRGGKVTDPDAAAWLIRPYYEGGRWKEAEKLSVQVLETRTCVLGEEDPNTMTTMSQLALTYWSQGRLKESEKLCLRAVEMRKRVLGEDHSDTLDSVGNLALTYWSQGRWKESEDLAVQATEMRKRVLGEEHPGTLASISNLGLLYGRQGRWDKFVELVVQVIETRKKILGEEHPETLTSMANLAWGYYCQGRWKESEELGVRVVEMSKRVLGENHFNTKRRIANLSQIVNNRGHGTS